MNFYRLLFYILGILVLAFTLMAVTKKNPIHALLFLVASFLGTAMIFYLLGAPFLSLIQVIIYAGAIMILFLFLVITLKMDATKEKTSLLQWLPAILPGLLFLALGIAVLFTDPEGAKGLIPATASPADFGRFIYENYWAGVEIVSLILFLGLLA
ncbi:MAG: NADH-quinone oxidoreductase subunit J, partial [Deltaproteobacteria bacterium]